ncbi:organic solute transporter Ostalpha-domain-containing protein [Boeremia exigua]|uniref:organic solute transporter Ostalpha-domain-containing protein n=1 Tax=Boeremia exigua TaxID=749465 RepID=UPI001E8D891E|nr:organic solute transporter Ostalpha-domain-containing protein [Boeremia exigua]KAH6621926.1 organic solute transporter Ostalpha-domain-containing protein [Boeremia exigua]
MGISDVLLITRKNHLNASSIVGSATSHVCPVENLNGPAIVPIVGNYTFHEVATIVAGTCALFSIIICIFIIAGHAANYSFPVQQRQIIRIVLLIPWVALFSFLIVLEEKAGVYIVASLDFGCAIALSAFLLLMCDFVLSHPDGFDDLFGVGAMNRGALQTKGPAWFKRVWYGVLQFIPASIIIWIGTIVALAVGQYCRQSNSVHFAHLWITIFKFIVTTISILCCLRFHSRNKPKLLQHKILLKLFTFKSIIGLNVAQTFIINILAGHGTLSPNKYMTYHDINDGLASLILACEMPIFALLMIFAFPSKPYKNSNKAASVGPFKAIVQALDIRDLLGAIVRGPMRLVREQEREIRRGGSIKMEMQNGGPGVDGVDQSTMYKGSNERVGLAV